MDDLFVEVDQIKQEYQEAKQAYAEEKEALLRVINTFSLVVDMHPDFCGACHNIKEMLDSDNGLPAEDIKSELGELRQIIYDNEIRGGTIFVDRKAFESQHLRLQQMCRTMKRMTLSILDGFYPLPPDLKARSDAIDFGCHKDIADLDIETQADRFIDFVKALKEKIGNDFSLVNSTFQILLEQVKDLEKMLEREFGGPQRIRDIEAFETRVNQEVNFITDSFDICKTVQEIKNDVSQRLSKIRHLMAKKKEEELQGANKVQEQISTLKKRIVAAETNALQLSKKAEHFEKAAAKDGLTGLYNRQSFDEKLAETLGRLKKGGPPFALVLFDIDKFKWVNDTFGHVAGDKVLKTVAQTLREAFRSNDFLARYGGDEFAVLVEGISEAMADERIVEFNKGFRKKRFVSPIMENGVQINVTAGLAMARVDESVEELINRADMAMYTSKRKCR